METPEQPLESAPEPKRKRVVTEKMIEANRRNAKLGGPKTAAGKAKVRLNSVKHGLCAKTAVMPYEQKADFDRFHAGMVRSWNPISDDEIAMCEHYATQFWRMRRLSGVECGIFTKYMEGVQASEGAPRDASKGSDTLMGATLMEVPDEKFRNYFRYGREIHREFYRARGEMKAMRDRRDYLSINGFTHLVESGKPLVSHAGSAPAALASTPAPEKPPATPQPRAPLVAAIFVLLALVLTGLGAKLEAASHVPATSGSPAAPHGFVSSTTVSSFDPPQRR